MHFISICLLWKVYFMFYVDMYFLICLCQIGQAVSFVYLPGPCHCVNNVPLQKKQKKKIQNCTINLRPTGVIRFTTYTMWTFTVKMKTIDQNIALTLAICSCTFILWFHFPQQCPFYGPQQIPYNLTHFKTIFSNQLQVPAGNKHRFWPTLKIASWIA